MRLGINGTGLVQKASIDAIAEDAARAAADGLTSYWLAEHPTGGFDAICGLVTKGLSHYGDLPSYRAMFDREGVDGPGDVALIGDEAFVRSKLFELAEAGVTDFAATEFTPAPADRTRELLISFAESGA